MQTLPHELYRADQVRELDRMVIENHGIPGIELMRRAGGQAFAYLRRRWPACRRLAVLCGTGNNGGDGYVVARLARQQGFDVTVIQVGEPEKIVGTAAIAAQEAAAAEVPVRPLDGDLLGHDFELVVDGVLGTGLRGAVTGAAREAIERINGSGLPVFSLDIPSGLDADRGIVLGAAVRAEATITFIGLKQGMFTAQGPDCVGELVFAGLGLPEAVYAAVPAAAARVDLARFPGLFAARPRSSHKGRNGHVLVVGGDQGMAGAVRMAAEAAARVGAGLVSVATRPSHANIVGLGRPELMCHGADAAAELKPLLDRADVVAVGPGLGRDEWGRRMLATVLESRRPLVVDADAINLLAVEPARRGNWILTPHPGEAARLLECTTAEVQADRFAAAAGVQASFGGVCVLKGAGTVIVDGEAPPAVCSAGNPGMATGGMGDVLTGVIASLVSQGADPATAARAGVCLHAGAGDAAAADGERGMLATDLYPHLRRLANP